MDSQASNSAKKSLGRVINIEETKYEETFRMRQEHDLNFREVQIHYVSGTIDFDDVMRFKLLVFRSTRGKIKVSFLN